jgi:hypothetical protein
MTSLSLCEALTALMTFGLPQEGSFHAKHQAMLSIVSVALMGAR